MKFCLWRSAFLAELFIFGAIDTGALAGSKNLERRPAGDKFLPARRQKNSGEKTAK